MITYLLICQPIRKQSNVILLSVCCNGNFGYANSVCQIKVYIKKKKQIVAINLKKISPFQGEKINLFGCRCGSASFCVD